MYSKLKSFGLRGLSGFPVTVEADVSGGLPALNIVGLPDSAVKESGDRVRSALKNLGYKWPDSRLTVNLAPADVKKTGPVYDLPVFLAVLTASGQLKKISEDIAFLGELALDGTLRPVTGVLSMALCAAEQGIKQIYLPAANAAEAAATATDDLTIYAVNTAREVVEALQGTLELTPTLPLDYKPDSAWQNIPDFADVRGQSLARRALEIAAAGGHNLLMIGVPGSGKSMLAKRFSGILPPPTRAEATEITKIYSIAGLLRAGSGLISERPFRSPHHSTSAVALAGGGASFRPGEVSLAHGGILFLDELPEFTRDCLEVLRQPIEDGVVTVSRIAGSATYPSNFILIGAMNGCKCGYYGHPTKECVCTPSSIERYRSRVSGPILDRIDLHVEMEAIAYEDISATGKSENSATIRERVLTAREKQLTRYEKLGLKDVFCNANLTPAQIRKVCTMTKAAESILHTAYDNMALSARAYDRILRVARTVADLSGEEDIGEYSLLEALQYRAMDYKA